MIDLTTLYIVVAFGGVVAGIVHVVPWATGWFGHWAAWWGFGHIALGISALGAILRLMGLPEWLVMLGNPMAIVAYAAIYCGMRSFCGLPSRTTLLMSTAILATLPVLVFVDRESFPMRVAYICIVRSMFDVCTVILAVRLARRERLQTAWIVVVMFAATVPMFLTRVWLAVTGQLGTQLIGLHNDLAGWLAAGQICFILFRGFSLFLLQAERGQHALTEQAERDPLTAAFNRAGFDRRRAQWTGDGAIIVIDLDRFKQLNDTCGHAAGDAVLRIVAGVASDAVVPHGGMVVRWGGDEFVCVLPGTTSAAAIAMVANLHARLYAATRSAVSADIAVGASIGVAYGSLVNALALLAQADAAMYSVKKERDIAQRSVAGSCPPTPLISQAQHG